MPIDPRTLERYQVLAISIPSNPDTQESRGSVSVVVLGHQKGCVLGFQALTATAPYKANPKKAAGCVLYKANQVPQFSTEVAIAAKSPRVIPYSKIIEADRNNTLQVYAPLPKDFDGLIRAAIIQSVELEKGMRPALISLLDS